VEDKPWRKTAQVGIMLIADDHAAKTY